MTLIFQLHPDYSNPNDQWFRLIEIEGGVSFEYDDNKTLLLGDLLPSNQVHDLCDQYSGRTVKIRL